MSGPTVVVVTHGRAGRMTTTDVVPGCVVCVAETQLPLYREAHPGLEYEVHPDDVRGISQKRQWVYERFGDVFMLDDDVLDIRDVSSSTSRIIGGEEFLEIVSRAHDTAEQLGVYMYGFTDMAHPMVYDPLKPFRLTGFLHGNGLGMRSGSGLWFHPQLATFDDLWLSALNLSEHRILFQDRRYGITIKDTGHNVGGNAAIRTTESYRQDRRILVEAFGPEVIGLKGDTHNHKRHNTEQLGLRRPW